VHCAIQLLIHRKSLLQSVHTLLMQSKLTVTESKSRWDCETKASMKRSDYWMRVEWIPLPSVCDVSVCDSPKILLLIFKALSKISLAFLNSSSSPYFIPVNDMNTLAIRCGLSCTRKAHIPSWLCVMPRFVKCMQTDGCEWPLISCRMAKQRSKAACFSSYSPNSS